MFCFDEIIRWFGCEYDVGFGYGFVIDSKKFHRWSLSRYYLPSCLGTGFLVWGSLPRVDLGDWGWSWFHWAYISTTRVFKQTQWGIHTDERSWNQTGLVWEMGYVLTRSRLCLCGRWMMWPQAFFLQVGVHVDHYKLVPSRKGEGFCDF